MKTLEQLAIQGELPSPKGVARVVQTAPVSHGIL